MKVGTSYGVNVGTRCAQFCCAGVLRVVEVVLVDKTPHFVLVNCDLRIERERVLAIEYVRHAYKYALEQRSVSVARTYPL